ncbi:HTH_48 domain-containing protein [Nephila pilipes]|uniref:HTH_48 domain-containing protein n=1 Tax=Nephila pilipes TaxID=299642 RepID=A0A8X6TA92_NEPPI|nr:HTH_48 domain-containing protein [Nephila pilipes]
MYTVIENLAKCEVRRVIRFFWARAWLEAGISSKMRVIYDSNIMNKGEVHQWDKFFKERRANIPDELRSGRPSVVNDDLAKQIDNKDRENLQQSLLKFAVTVIL